MFGPLKGRHDSGTWRAKEFSAKSNKGAQAGYLFCLGLL